MEIPPVKKSAFYIISAVVLLAGLVLGVFLASFAFYKNKSALCAITGPVLKTEISQKAIDEVSSLEPGDVLFGKVKSASSGKIVLEVRLANPLDANNSKTIDVNVPVSQNDKIVRLKSVDGSSNLQMVASSISTAKVGDAITVKITSDGAKIIYLPTI